MIRTDRWKLIHSAGNRRRRDGYTVGPGLPGPSTRLFDLEADPVELVDVTKRPENLALVGELLGPLARHRLETSRRPVPIEGDEAEARSMLARTLPPDPGRRLVGSTQERRLAILPIGGVLVIMRSIRVRSVTSLWGRIPFVVPEICR